MLEVEVPFSIVPSSGVIGQVSHLQLPQKSLQPWVHFRRVRSLCCFWAANRWVNGIEYLAAYEHVI